MLITKPIRSLLAWESSPHSLTAEIIRLSGILKIPFRFGTAIGIEIGDHVGIEKPKVYQTRWENHVMPVKGKLTDLSWR